MTKETGPGPLDSEIGVECQLLTIPKPIGFIVTNKASGRIVAALTYFQVNKALLEFAMMK